mmetsp:Transcript_14856/g.26406  ORF Transcript_14856/g.26406 Transcript_14856/m.26406 type:complete len:82 (-) Transcript_14856:616-861(-)
MCPQTCGSTVPKSGPICSTAPLLAASLGTCMQVGRVHFLWYQPLPHTYPYQAPPSPALTALHFAFTLECMICVPDQEIAES